MPIKKINCTIKFNQSDLIEYIHKNTHDDFIKKIIGVDNVNYIYSGLCYGLTDRFLMSAYKSQEIAFLQNLISSFNIISSSKSHNTPSDNQHSFYEQKACFNILFHDIVKAQLNQNVFADIQNTIYQFTYPPINKKETAESYMNRVVDQNIRKIDSSKRALIPYFHQIKVILKQVNLAIRSPSHQLSKIENNTNFLTFIERVKHSCLNPQKNSISTEKIKIFFYYVAKYLSKEVLNKTIFYNEIMGASYSSETKNMKNYDTSDHKETISLKELNGRINKITNERKTLACDLCNTNHAMAIIVKPLTYNEISFELFDPNKGLFTTNRKTVFLKLINRIVNKKHSDFHVNINGEKLVEITRNLIIDKKGK